MSKFHRYYSRAYAERVPERPGQIVFETMDSLTAAAGMNPQGTIYATRRAVEAELKEATIPIPNVRRK